MTRKKGNSRDGYGVPARVFRAGAPGLPPQLTASRSPWSCDLIPRCPIPPRGRKHTVTRSHPREDSAVPSDHSPPQHPQRHCPEQALVSSSDDHNTPFSVFPPLVQALSGHPPTAWRGYSLGVAVPRSVFYGSVTHKVPCKWKRLGSPLPLCSLPTFLLNV